MKSRGFLILRVFLELCLAYAFLDMARLNWFGVFGSPISLILAVVLLVDGIRVIFRLSREPRDLSLRG